jgi:hypothetical protein
MQLSISLRNGVLVRKGLQDLNKEIPQIGRQQIRTRLERIKRRMQAYPPERPGQSVRVEHPVLGYTIKAKRYKRTGRFGRSWSIERIGNTGYMLKNDARDPRTRRRYGHYVVGNAYGAGQAWMHKGRWEVLRDVAEEELQTLPPAVEREINMVARRIG